MMPARLRAWAQARFTRFLARIVWARAKTPFGLLQERHFERKLFVLEVGGRPLALANTPELARRILGDREETFPKAAVVGELLRPLIGAGLFGAAGPAVSVSRKLLIKAIVQVPDPEVERVTADLVRAYLARWREAGEAGIPICEEFARLTIDVVSACLLGRRFAENDSRRFTELFFRFHKRADPMDLFLGRLRRSRRRELDAIGAEMRSLIRSTFLDPLLGRPQALQAIPYGRALIAEGWLDAAGHPTGPESRILDETAVLLLAGHETTATTLAWLFSTLGNRPDAQDRLARAAATDDGAEIDAAINEALRLYPPIPFYARDVTGDTEMRERPIRAGGLAIVSPWTLHRHRALWPKPDEFSPERWLEPGFKPQSGAYLPFAAGARACPGARFAMVEMRTILRTIFAEHRLALAEPHAASPRPLGNLTARPDREIMMFVQPARIAAVAPA